jgi:hypothetical protein
MGHIWNSRLAGLVVTLAVLPVAPARQPLHPTGLMALPDSGALLGVHLELDEHNGFDRRQAMVDFEALVGRPMAVDREFYEWDEAWPTSDDEWSRASGRMLFFSWDPIQRADGLCVGWDKIANGEYDATLDAQAAKIIAFGAPVIFSFSHEPTNAPPGGNSCGTPDDFIAAWRHVRERFDAAGVANATHAVTLTALTFQRGRADLYYPGDDVVDLLAADGYNWYQCGGWPWRPFEELFTPFHDYGVLHDKPMFVAEYGTGEDDQLPGRKAQWFTDAADTLRQWPDVKGASYFNAGKHGCDRYVDSSQSSLDAFTAMGGEPYFNPPTPLRRVTVSDFAFTPRDVSAPMGTGTEWSFVGPSVHTVTDASGMGLFDSGTVDQGGEFRYYFIGAGNYRFQCLIHPQMTGQVNVPLSAYPRRGDISTEFTITWSADLAPTGRAFGVQIKRPGEAQWSTWLAQQTGMSAIFEPDAGTGTYWFRARYLNTDGGGASQPSAAVAIEVR